MTAAFNNVSLKAYAALRRQHSVLYVRWCALTRVPNHCFQTGLLAKNWLQ